MNTPHNRIRRGAAILFSGVLILGGLALAGEATAVEEVPGNPTCSDLGYTYGDKSVESPGDGYHPIGGEGMDATLRVGTYTSPNPLDPNANPNANNAIIGYSISTDADGYAIVVKGGNGANVYRQGKLINPMHAPAVSSDKWPTISHFQLCWNKPADEPEVGQLKVTKVVAGEGAPADVEFEIGVTPSGGGKTLYQKVKGGGTVTFGNLPIGKYVVTETPPGQSWAVEGSGVTVTIELEDTTKATVTNTWISPSDEFGRVEVTKAVTGDGAPTDGKYEICLTGPDPSTTKVCKTITGKGTLTFADLVPGSYTVTETDPGTEYKATITPATVKVTIGEVVTATVTNEYTQQESLPPTVPVTPEVLPPTPEVLPPTEEALPPATPVTPTTPATPTAPAAPVTPAAPTQVAAQQSALPATGSEGGLAAIAVVLVAAGVGLTLLSKRHGPQQA